ncbi:hypothetical protein PR002_g1253 [Phytophthora rubi]|uniref:Reverse transcriptase Ty1/copia-type domain-containing protein n=1 Tax=Phytophthora rubi TaxID=129364 RepID=A0A6A3P348_9STRA|nr:hypothetical protein PR002_g1253 [Phytophthora rubi]
MVIPKEILKMLGVEHDEDVVLELKKALYGLKQAGRLWNRLMHKTLVEIGQQQSAVNAFFEKLEEFSFKDLGRASEFLGMQVVDDDEHGYDLDQEVMILETLKDHGMEKSNGVQIPIGPDWNEVRGSEGEKLPVTGSGDIISVRELQSLVGV